MKHTLILSTLVFATLIFDSGLTCFGQIESVCGCADETDLNDETIFSLTAPQGFKLGPVLFASYGTPVGDCDGLLGYGGCHSENSIEIIENLITENDSTISIYPNNNTFADPCAGIVKRLCVRIGLLQLGPLGCTDIESCNFDEQAVYDDGSCISCDLFAERCLDGTVWDEELRGCVVASASDTDFDGCVGMTDLLDLLSVFGTCNETSWSCGDPLEYQGYDYETVQIGEQCWFAENLLSEYYQNGDFIPANLPDSVWASTTEGAVAIYGEGDSPVLTGSTNEVQNLLVYGRMYNSYACADERNLCPSGWRVPLTSDFNDLTSWAQENSIDSLGVKLRHVETWNPNAISTDELGFGWKAGGNKVSGGAFNGQQGYGEMMLSDCPCWAELKYDWNLEYQVEGLYNGPQMAASVRCIKNDE